MSEATMECPECGTEISLSESLAAPMIKEMEARHKREVTELQDTTRQAQEDIENAELEIDQKIKEGHDKIRRAETAKAQAAALEELQEMETRLEDNNEKLAEAQKAQATVLRRERELADAKREMDLEIERKIQDGLIDERMKARKDAEYSIGLRVREKEETIASMAKQLQ